MQIGYFKAKHAFFRFDWSEVEDDCAFVLSRYFHGVDFERKAITKHEHYTQRERIAEWFGYRSWMADLLPPLAQQAAQIARRDVTPGFVAAELIFWLDEHKIIRPGYTTLQERVSATLSAERRRLGGLLAEALDDRARTALTQLLVRDNTLSELAVLRQDAKDFGWRQMARERERRTTLEPLHVIAKTLLPKLGISQQNVRYYASLASFYTVHDLRNLKPDQAHLYLLCYVWLRYRQLADNLVDAMACHMKRLEDESRAGAKQSFVAEQVRRQQETPRVGRLLLLYVDDTVADATPFGNVRQRAYKIMPKDAVQLIGQRMSVKPASKLALQPLADRLGEQLRQQPVLHADETPVALLDPKAGKTRRAYLFAYSNARHAGADPPRGVFQFQTSRSGQHARQFLGHWQGALMVDDCSGYKSSFAQGVTELACWAHARRKWFEQHAASGSAIAAEALARIAVLYRIETAHER